MDILSASSPVDPDLLKAPKILLDKTVKRYAVDREDLKIILDIGKLRKKGDQQLFYLEVFQRLY